MNTYEKYAILINEIKVLEEKKDALKNEILQEMVDKEQDKIQTTVGSFTVAKLKKWEYPAKVVELGEKFKTAKAKAESTGEAKFVETPSLRFTGITL